MPFHQCWKEYATMKLWQEFKAFAFKGNMIDLAVAVVIGAAFSGVINSLVKDIIMPSITYVTTSAKTAVETTAQVAQKAASAVVATTQPSTTESTQPAAAQAAPPPPAPAAPPAPAPAAPADDKAVDFSWTIGRIRIGNFLAELVNFILVSFAVFITIVKLMGSVMKKIVPTQPSEPVTKECPKCFSVIPIKATKCAFCTADLPL
jgi:large conductance mechanosensitive channel